MEILVYILDDHKQLLNNIAQMFEYENIKNFQTFSDPDEYIKALVPEVHVCIIDFRYNRRSENGLDIMRITKEKNPGCFCIIISAHIDTMQYLKVSNENAYKFLDKMDPEFDKDLVRYTKMAIKEARDSFERIGKLYEKYNKRSNY